MSNLFTGPRALSTHMWIDRGPWNRNSCTMFSQNLLVSRRLHFLMASGTLGQIGWGRSMKGLGDWKWFLKHRIQRDQSIYVYIYLFIHFLFIYLSIYLFIFVYLYRYQIHAYVCTCVYAPAHTFTLTVKDMPICDDVNTGTPYTCVNVVQVWPSQGLWQKNRSIPKGKQPWNERYGCGSRWWKGECRSQCFWLVLVKIDLSHVFMNAGATFIACGWCGWDSNEIQR